ncbi:hypothetical protein [Streptomyces sp. NBC_01217]|uniref:hypothetical protein n=1 Tax=Streptomyces sp. NBC_01217 TaxID=2903779 RepID=UPI003FA3B1D4|nr:hypothetical protein OG507_30815 [Streptomyces sp. NBC_01217]
MFESPKALADQEDWGTPDKLDAAFADTCDTVRKGIPLMWRDRWWRMFDRDPVETWVHGRIALLGDTPHPPLQYMAQGAIMAIEDGWVLAQHYARLAAATPSGTEPNWDGALAAYEAVRVEHRHRVQTTPRAWGELWHLDGESRLRRNAIMRAGHPRLLLLHRLGVRSDRADAGRGARDVHADPALLGGRRGAGGLTR